MPNNLFYVILAALGGVISLVFAIRHFINAHNKIGGPYEDVLGVLCSLLVLICGAQLFSML